MSSYFSKTKSKSKSKSKSKFKSKSKSKSKASSYFSKTKSRSKSKTKSKTKSVASGYFSKTKSKSRSKSTRYTPISIASTISSNNNSFSKSFGERRHSPYTRSSSQEEKHFNNDDDILLESFYSPEYKRFLDFRKEETEDYLWTYRPYQKIVNESINFLTNKYKNHIDICSTNENILCKFEIDHTKNAIIDTKFKFLGNKSTFKRCLNNNDIKIILLNNNLIVKYLDEDGKEIKEEEVRHRVITIINKHLKTIEMYDPAGYEWYNYEELKDINFEDEINGGIRDLLSEFSQLDKYKLMSFSETCPNFSFQHFENKFIRRYKKRGLCMIWSVFLADLRIKYYKLNPDKLREKIEKLIKNIGKQKKVAKTFSNFIHEYTLYVESKLNLTY